MHCFRQMTFTMNSIYKVVEWSKTSLKLVWTRGVFLIYHYPRWYFLGGISGSPVKQKTQTSISWDFGPMGFNLSRTTASHIPPAYTPILPFSFFFYFSPSRIFPQNTAFPVYLAGLNKVVKILPPIGARFAMSREPGGSATKILALPFFFLFVSFFP